MAGVVLGRYKCLVELAVEVSWIDRLVVVPYLRCLTAVVEVLASLRSTEFFLEGRLELRVASQCYIGT